AKTVLALLAGVLIYSGFWFYGAMQVIGTAEQWIVERRADGYRIQYNDLRASGYPFAIRIKLNDVGFGDPNGAAPWAWQGQNLVISTRPWRLDRVHMQITGKQVFSYQKLNFRGSLNAADLDLVHDNGDPQSLTLTISGFDLAAGPGAGEKISLASASINLRRLTGQGETLALDVTSAGIDMPSVMDWPLGRRIADLRLAARLLGDLPRGAGAPLVEVLEIWRDGGGTVEIDRFVIDHGPLKLTTDGTLALDRNLQPVGAFTARISGFFETIDAFSRQGIIGVRQAIAAKLLLGVLARRPQGGGPSILNLAVTLQGRDLYAGPVKLLRMPMVNWR
ncbi:MAG TPA: DUF2125 domain-containing protein, partial [Rhodospirillales bacterium]|nr:DUF2125 domain-containing protein [Rhodospirillales bacterium]